MPTATLQPRTTLGRVLADVHTLLTHWADDPISEAYGFWPDPGPTLCALIAAQGWTVDAIVAATEKQMGTTYRAHCLLSPLPECRDA